MTQNRLQDRVDRLAERLQDEAGRSVVYLQGIATVSITATAADKIHTVYNEDGIPTKVQFSDWIISTSEMSLLAEPRPGDRIIETLGGVEYIYEVQPIDDKRPCFEWHDTGHTMFRIHTIRVS
jgi:hypothetical protein